MQSCQQIWRARQQNAASYKNQLQPLHAIHRVWRRRQEHYFVRANFALFVHIVSCRLPICIVMLLMWACLSLLMDCCRYDIRGGQPLAVVQGATDAATSVRGACMHAPSLHISSFTLTLSPSTLPLSPFPLHILALALTLMISHVFFTGLFSPSASCNGVWQLRRWSKALFR